MLFSITLENRYLRFYSHICYVCQKGGRLLGCDYCEQSYHPRCIDADFLEFEAERGAWRCPICRGEDPLKSFGNRRLSRTAMMRLMNTMQQCIRAQYKISKANRDVFLWSNIKLLRPFLVDHAYNRLVKKYGAGRKKFDTQQSGSETEEDDVERGVRAPNLSKSQQKRFERWYEKAVKAGKGHILQDDVRLKDYQKAGVGWLLECFHRRSGAILADEMGLGKTVQTLAFLSALKVMGITGPHLIVVPLCTVGNWAREIRRFVPHLKFVKVCGSRFERDHIMNSQVTAQGLHDLYITTYETAVTEESFFCDTFDWQCIILDEAHRIKNESGRIRNSLNRVGANMRVLLTGTPLQNNVKELFTLLNYLFPDTLKDSDEFERLMSRHPTTGKELAKSDVDNLDIHADIVDALSQLLNELMLRRTKDLVVNLPPKIEHNIWVPLSQHGAIWYKKLLDVSEAAIQANFVRKILGAVIKMRICVCHPCCLIKFDTQLKKFQEAFAATEHESNLVRDAKELAELSNEEHIKASNKLVVLDKLLTQLHLLNCEFSSEYREMYLQNIQNHLIETPIIHKVLIFTQFQLVLDELERYCKHRGFRYLRLDGGTNKMIRELDIREFNNPDSTHLLYLICTRAGGVGINLYTANHVVLFDEDWNPFMDLQAIDRAHRIGQKRSVHVWKLITEWTIEERMRMAFRRMQKMKLDQIFIQSSARSSGAKGLPNEDSPEALDYGAKSDAYLRSMKLEELSRLTRYGREAIKSVVNESENIYDLSFDEVINRKRKSLP
uniref:Probable chromatin-remodeling complex ATPase chain n=1 Tax=Dermatophagoides pteronyssinus TaxID=6956 RepID=A0A6P6Y522_DERPT